MIRVNSPFVINSLRQLSGTIKTQLNITSSLVAHLCRISNSATVPGKPMGQSANFVPQPAAKSSAGGVHARAAETPAPAAGLSDRLKPLLSDLQLRPEIAAQKPDASVSSTQGRQQLTSAMIEQLVTIIKNDEASFDRTDWRPNGAPAASPLKPVRQAPPPPPPPMPDAGFNRPVRENPVEIRQKPDINSRRLNSSRPPQTLSVMAELEQRLKNNGKQITDKEDIVQKVHLSAKRHLSAPAGLPESRVESQQESRTVKSETFSHQAMLDELRQTFARLQKK